MIHIFKQKLLTTHGWDVAIQGAEMEYPLCVDVQQDQSFGRLSSLKFYCTSQKQRQGRQISTWLIHNPQQTSHLTPKTLVGLEAGCWSGAGRKTIDKNNPKIKVKNWVFCSRSGEHIARMACVGFLNFRWFTQDWHEQRRRLNKAWSKCYLQLQL